LGKRICDCKKIQLPYIPTHDGLGGLFPLPLNQLMAKRRRIDSMIGTTIRESIFKPAENETVNATTVANLCNEIISGAKYRNQESIISECQRHYTQIGNNSNVTSDFWTVRARDLKDDFMYHAPAFKEADSLRSRKAKVYLYSFDYSKQGQESSTPFHSFDLTYVIGLHPFVFDNRDVQLQNLYVDLFANFTKYGTPTTGQLKSSSWLPLLVPHGFNYYSIDLPAGAMKSKYHTDAVMFWNYVVPALENRNDPSYYWGGRRSAVSDPQVNATTEIDHSKAEIDHAKVVRFWRTAFWITLSVLVLTAIVAISFFVCGLRKMCMKRQRRALEIDSLLVPDSGKYSYQTF